MADALAPNEDRLRRVTRSPRLKKLAIWAGALLAAFAIVGFLVVPPIAKAQLEKRLAEALKRPVTIAAVSVNPFAPSVTVRGFAVRERSGEEMFVTFDELYANASWSSVFRLAPVVDAVRLVKPHVRVQRAPDGKYNFQDLLDAALAPRADAAPPAEEKPPRFAVFNIELVDGRIDFDDRLEGEKHEVADLRIGIPFVSSLPAHVEVRVQPEISAKVNGAPLGVKGETLPFTDTRAATLNVDLDDLDLTRFYDYLPEKPNAKLRSALLDTRLVIAFEQRPGARATVKVSGSAAVERVEVRDAQDRPVAGWKRLGIAINDVEPLAPSVDLKEVTLDGLDLSVIRERDGTVNLARLGQAVAKGQARQDIARKETGAEALPIKVGLLAIKDGKVRFRDETTSPAFETVVGALDVEAKNFDTAANQRAEFSLALQTDGGEAVKGTGGWTANPRASDGRIEVTGIKLKRYMPYVRPLADVEIEDGQVDAAAAFKWSADLGFVNQVVSVTDAGATLKGLRVRLAGDREPLLRIGSLEVKETVADTAARTVKVGDVAIRDLAALLRREKDGRLNVARIQRAAAKAEAPSPEGSAPWRIDLGKLALERGAITVEDAAIAPALTIQVAPLAVQAENLSTAKGQKGTVSVRATVDKTGTLNVAGPLSIDPPAGSLRVEARTLSFAAVQRYIDDQVNLSLTSGAVSAKGTVSFELPSAGPIRASYAGDVNLTDVATIDKPTAQDLVKWKSLALGGIDFTLEPMKVALKEVALADFYARVILSAEGRINLQELARSPGAASAPSAAQDQPAAGSPKPAAEAAKPAATDGPKPGAAPAGLPANISVGRIVLQGGNVNFSDFFIKPNYTANLTGIGGAISEMTPEKAGDVELRGKVDNAAPVEILGQINPLARDVFLDIKASARDIELPPLSPYSVKYAGYGIERGKLSVNVKYKVENRKLAAENNIYLDQLTFGDKVDSPTATKLPVTLAVALLKDRNGVIDVNLPISGSLDDPQFSVGGIIVQVIVNLIVKAVTAPFALLGSLFGGGEELAYLEFAPGSSKLDKEDTGKLGNITKALTERPGLKLDVAGRVDPAADREGLKRGSIERKVKVQKFNDLRREGKAPASADLVEVDKAEYERYLRRAYGDESFPKPRNVIGIAKDLPVPEMETLMLTNAQVGDEDLRQLANARAQAAKEWLVSEGKIPEGRVFIVAPKLTAEGIKDKGQPTRVDFVLK